MVKTAEDIKKIAQDVCTFIRSSNLDGIEALAALAIATQVCSAWHTSEWQKMMAGLPTHDAATCEDCKNDKPH